MAKSVVIFSSSLRGNSNSRILAEEFAKGAKDAGNNVKYISLKDKNISFCTGCLACEKTGKCVIKDDATDFAEIVYNTDVVVFATPVYFYEMSGQMKTVLDRMNALFTQPDYHFRDVYILSVAFEDEPTTFDGTILGIQGWIKCFPKANLSGTVLCGGIGDPGQIKGNAVLLDAYNLGKNV